MSYTSKEYLEHLQCDSSPSPLLEYALPALAGRRVLDAGCGQGNHLRLLPGGIGIDISGPNVRSCRVKGLVVSQQDLNLPLAFAAGSFDAVLCSHVLEHVDAPIQLLREFRRVLADDGVLVLILPSENVLINVLAEHYFLGHRGHLYALSLGNIRQLLQKAGFRVDYVRVQLPFAGRRVLRWWTALANRLPASWFLWCSRAYLVQATKDD